MAFTSRSYLNYVSFKGKLVLFDERKQAALLIIIKKYFHQKLFFNFNTPKYMEWFQGDFDEFSIIANCLNLPHNEKEMVRLDINENVLVIICSELIL